MTTLSCIARNLILNPNTIEYNRGEPSHNDDVLHERVDLPGNRRVSKRSPKHREGTFVLIKKKVKNGDDSYHGRHIERESSGDRVYFKGT